MELRRPCKMMSTDQWERRIPVSWSSSAFWLVEPAAGHKNAHQHEWAAILHYLGPFAAYFAPYPPTATFYNQPLYCTNNDSAVKSPKNRDHRRNLSKFWFCADDYESLCCPMKPSDLKSSKWLPMPKVKLSLRKWKLTRLLIIAGFIHILVINPCTLIIHMLVLFYSWTCQVAGFGCWRQRTRKRRRVRSQQRRGWYSSKRRFLRSPNRLFHYHPQNLHCRPHSFPTCPPAAVTSLLSSVTAAASAAAVAAAVSMAAGGGNHQAPSPKLSCLQSLPGWPP